MKKHPIILGFSGLAITLLVAMKPGSKQEQRNAVLPVISCYSAVTDTVPKTRKSGKKGTVKYGRDSTSVKVRSHKHESVDSLNGANRAGRVRKKVRSTDSSYHTY